MTRRLKAITAAVLIAALGAVAVLVLRPSQQRAREVFDEHRRPIQHDSIAPTGHAVIVRVRVSEDIDAAGTDTAQLRDTLTSAASAAGVGGFDSELSDSGICSLRFYGPDADRLFRALEPHLRGVGWLRGSTVILRHGRAGDENAQITVVHL